MLKPIIILIIFSTLFVRQQAFAWEHINWSIVYLIEWTDDIIEAEFIKKESGRFYFKFKDLEEELFSDTLIMKISESTYDTQEIETSDRILIFCNLYSNGERRDTLTGGGSFRIFKEGRILSPFRWDYHGKVGYAGGRKENNPSWQEYKARVIKIRKRMHSVRAYEHIADPIEKNGLIFKWLEKFKNELDLRCELDADCGWGFLGEKAFEWITSSNIPEDTWKAAKLRREIFHAEEKEWIGFTGMLTDKNGSSFKSFEWIDFLISKATDESLGLADRKQALFFLTTSSEKIYSRKKSKLDSVKYSKQQQYRDKIIPLLNDSFLKNFAFKALTDVWTYGESLDKSPMAKELLPIIKDYYHEEAPSDLKDDMAVYISKHSSKGEWKQFSGCDENLVFYIYSLRIDTISNALDFYIRCTHGHQNITANPTLTIQSLSEPETSYEMAYEFLSGRKTGNWRSAKTMRIDLSKLKKGSYQFYMTGKAGEESEFRWTSAYGQFQIN